MVEIDCKDVIRAVSLYLDGELPPEMRTLMRRHFAECRHCSAVLDGTRNVVQIIGDGRTFEVSNEFGARLFRRFDAKNE